MDIVTPYPINPMKIRVRDRRFVDELDRTVVLHGVNFSGRHKQPPFTSIEDGAALDPLRDFGFNVIRLVLVWEAIEPEPDRFDEDYLKRVGQIATWANERGIHVIMDLHQDIYSRSFGGSGAPEWTILPKLLEEGKTACNDPTWFMRYAQSTPVRESLSRFWRNEDGLQEHFIRSMVRAAEQLADHPEVIGWEIYNEPIGGSLQFSSFEQENLLPFYERSIEAVRAIAPDWICFYEGILFGSEQGTKIDLTKHQNVVYMPHFYIKDAHLQRSYEGNNKEMRQAFEQFEKDSVRKNIPWMLGEYGMMNDAPGAYEYMRDHENGLARNCTSGTAWHYNPTSEDWNDERMSIVEKGEETKVVDAVVRPYPRAVPGKLERYAFDDDQKRFSLKYTATDPDKDAVLFLPKRHFPNPEIAVDAKDGDYAYLPDQQLLVVRTAAGPVDIKVVGQRR